MPKDVKMPAIRQRVFRERLDCFNVYTDVELIKRFRLNRDGIEYVCSLVKDTIGPATDRNKAISAMTKTLITLRYLATGRMQLCSADHFGVSQPSVSRIISSVIDSLSSPTIFTRFIHFPTTLENVRLNQREFHSIANFPGIVGVIDGHPTYRLLHL